MVWGVIIVILVILGAIIYYYSGQPSAPSAQGPQGKMVLSVTDAAANMGAVTDIDMTVKEVDLHMQGGDWVTAATTTEDFHLLALKAAHQSALVSSTDLQAGTYDQIRVLIDKVEITANGSTTEAKLPSGEFKMNGDIVVNASSTSSVNLDFLADASLHQTGNGTYIFAPVVNMDSKSDADVTVSSDNKVMVSGGQGRGVAQAGMDVDGSVRADFKINPNSKIEIGALGGITIDGKSRSSDNVTGNATSSANANVNSNVNVTVPPVKVPGVSY